MSSILGLMLVAEFISATRMPGSEVVGWGLNNYGQTNAPNGFSNAVAIAAGQHHSLALNADGRVVGWGYNAYGQTNIPSGLSNVVAVAAGRDHSLALTAGGRVVGWGWNGYYQTNVPSGLSNVVAIAAGGDHSLALRAGGQLVGWGRNDYGQTTIPSGLGKVVAIAAGSDHSLALTADGRVVGWGRSNYGQTNVPSGLSNVVAIAAGYYHSLALTADGRVAVWGRNDYGQTNVPSGLSNVVGIAAGIWHSLALKADGRVVGWGRSNYGQTNIPSGLNSVVAIAAGGFHSLATKSDSAAVIVGQPISQLVNVGGTTVFKVWAAGWPPLTHRWWKDGIWLADGGKVSGATNSTLTLTNVQLSELGGYTVIVTNASGSATSAVANLRFSQTITFVDVLDKIEYDAPFALTATASSGLPVSYSSANPSVATLSGNMVTIVGRGTTQITATQPGDAVYGPAPPVTRTLSVTSEVVGWGNNDSGQRSIPSGLSSVVAVAAGGSHSLALTAEGRVVGWGSNGGGETSIPSGLSSVVAIAAGVGHSLALTADGRVVGWGRNTYGLTNIPSGLSNVVAIVAGPTHNLALTANGQVVGWGANTYGETSIPSGLSNVVAIAAGGFHSLALTAEGRVVGWGFNFYGETHAPSGLGNVVAIAAGANHSLALTAEGRVVGWGSNGGGETSIPSGLSNVVAIAAGYYHSLALTAEGRVVGWGYYNYGQTNIPSGLSNVVAIAAGNDHSLAIRKNGTPVITGQPLSRSEIAGRTVSFQVWAAGMPPLRYQWQKDGSNLPAETNAGLRLTGITPSHDGNYTVIVSNSTGQSVTSSVATLTVGYLLNTASSSGGLVIRDPDLPSYAPDSLVTLTATPSVGFGFIRWTGDATGSTSPLVVTMDTNKTITAVFDSYLLNVPASSGGSVTRDPNLPGYAPDSLVTLTATPSVGFGFIRWTGDATGSTSPLVVTMDTNKTITAVFASTALTLTSQGVGTAIKAPDQTNYAVGDEVALSATAGRWYEFSGWSDGANNNPRLVTIGESNRYTAVFTPITPLETVTIGGVSRSAPVGMPAVQVAGKFIVAESVSARGPALVKLSTTFPSGTLLYTLDGTAPSLASSLYTSQFTVAKTCVVRAIAFKSDFSSAVEADPVTVVILPTLTGTTAGGGSVAIQPPSGAYFSNSVALVTATPSAGWEFLQWLGDAEGTNPTVSLTMTRNKRVTAVFGTSLTTTIAGSGSMVVDPVAARYPYGSNVRLTAVPAESNYFAFWANAGLGKTNNPLLFSVRSANTTVTAAFASLSGSGTNALTIIADGRGQVTATPAWNRLPLNTSVALRAIPDAGQMFLGWGGAASGSANPLVITMLSNTVITANFTSVPRLQGEGYRELLAQEGFRLTLTGDWGVAYRIDHSTNLTGWTALTTLTNTFGTVQFTDGAATNLPQRFYRAVTSGD